MQEKLAVAGVWKNEGVSSDLWSAVDGNGRRSSAIPKKKSEQRRACWGAVTRR